MGEGLRYFGQVDSFDRPLGLGRLVSPTQIAEGWFDSNGDLDGFGRMIKEKSVEEGMWSHGQKHGVAKTNRDGLFGPSVSQGYFENDQIKTWFAFEF